MTRLCIFTNSDTPSVPCFEAEINWQGDALYKKSLYGSRSSFTRLIADDDTVSF